MKLCLAAIMSDKRLHACNVGKEAWPIYFVFVTNCDFRNLVSVFRKEIHDS